jgi:hypothetical protein
MLAVEVQPTGIRVDKTAPYLHAKRCGGTTAWCEKAGRGKYLSRAGQLGRI